MAGSKEHLRCINAEILLVISQMGKIFIRFVVPSAAIGKMFNMLNVRKAGLRKTRVFFKKKQPTCFFKNPFFGFFKKKQNFVIFSKKTEKAHSELFYSIMHYHYFQNYTIITSYTYYGIPD